MPFYVYLDLKHIFRGDLSLLWNSLKEKVIRGQLPDFASLQYPPHVTISGSFEMEEPKLSRLCTDLKNVLGAPFSTSIKSQQLYICPQICSYNFTWNELSMRVAQLKEMYPELPWVLSEYHLTLLHGPMCESSKSCSVMEKASKMIPQLPRLEKDFDVVVWKHNKLLGSTFSWESQSWVEVHRVPLSSL